MTYSEAIAILELKTSFSEAELKQAYREAIMVWHPDRFQENTTLKEKATTKTASINEAKAILDIHCRQQTNQLPRKPKVTPEAKSKQTSSSGTENSRTSDSWIQRNPGRATATAGFIILFAGGAFGINGESGAVWALIAGIMIFAGLILCIWDKDHFD